MKLRANLYKEKHAQEQMWFITERRGTMLINTKARKILFLLIAILLLVQNAWAMREEGGEESISSVIAGHNRVNIQRNKENLGDCPQQASLEEECIALSIPHSPLETDQILDSDDVPIKASLHSAKLVDPVDVLPIQLLTNVCIFLEVDDLGKLPQLSKSWQVVANAPDLWRYIGLTRYGDYLSEENLIENPKQKVVQHYLSIIVNMKDAGKEIEEMKRIASTYNLGTYNPCFKQYIPQKFLNDIINKVTRAIWYGGKGRAYENHQEEVVKGLRNLFLLKIGKSNSNELEKMEFDSSKNVTENKFAKEIEEFTNIASMFSFHGEYGGWYVPDYRSGSRVPPAYIYPPTYSRNKKAVDSIKDAVEQLIISNFPAVRAVGKYIKALAQKHGILELGYEKDYEEAIRFIEKYHVPY